MVCNKVLNKIYIKQLIIVIAAFVLIEWVIIIIAIRLSALLIFLLSLLFCVCNWYVCL